MPYDIKDWVAISKTATPEQKRQILYAIVYDAFDNLREAYRTFRMEDVTVNQVVFAGDCHSRGEGFLGIGVFDDKGGVVEQAISKKLVDLEKENTLLKAELEK